MPLASGQPVPNDVMDALRVAGIHGPCLLGVMKEGCGACEDALPLLDAALEGVPGVLLLVQEDPATTKSLQQAYAPHLAVLGDDAPHPLSAALDVIFTPTVFQLVNGRVVDMVDGFDPDGLHRVLLAHSEACGQPPLLLFDQDEPRPRFRAG